MRERDPKTDSNVCVYAVMFVFLSKDPSETAIPDTIHIIILGRLPTRRFAVVAYIIIYCMGRRATVNRARGTSFFRRQ